MLIDCRVDIVVGFGKDTHALNFFFGLPCFWSLARLLSVNAYIVVVLDCFGCFFFLNYLFVPTPQCYTSIPNSFTIQQACVYAGKYDVCRSSNVSNVININTYRHTHIHITHRDQQQKHFTHATKYCLPVNVCMKENI